MGLGGVMGALKGASMASLVLVYEPSFQTAS